MISRLIVRTVLVVIIFLVFGAIWFTGLQSSGNNFQKSLTILIEAGVGVAALSLLIESFLSFSRITVKRNNRWWNFLSGAPLFNHERKVQSTSTVKVRTCMLFALRSVWLAFLSFFTMILVAGLYEFGKILLLFLLNPHLPVVHWPEVIKYTVMMILTLLAVWPVIIGVKLLEQKIAGLHIIPRFLIFNLCGSVVFGLFLGLLIKFSDESLLAKMPLYWMIAESIGVVFVLISAAGIIVGIGLGLYKLVGKLSQRYVWLASAYNQICPMQTIHFEE